MLDMADVPCDPIRSGMSGVGISLSGGGLRAACFSFGVLQVLQEKRSLVYGPRCANYIAAVSGGSYIAATYALGARHQALHPDDYQAKPLLSEGSTEESHILSHGRYLEHNPLRFVALVVLNFIALVMLFVWAGTMLADLAYLRPLIGIPSDVFVVTDRIPLYLVVPLVAGSVFMLVRFLYSDGGWRRYLPPLFCGPLLLLCRPALDAATRYNWWSPSIIIKVVALLVALLVLLALSTRLAQHAGIRGNLAVILNSMAAVAPRILGLFLLTWSSLYWYRLLTEALTTRHDLQVSIAFFASLVGGLLFSEIPHRASLHREYRTRLESCFCVRRNGATADRVADPLLSELTPPQEDAFRFPQLLICATANVHVPGRGGSLFMPFVFSYDRCGVPGINGVTFSTSKLELGREPAGLFTFRKEPLISLFTAVAATGAAVAPSMGRYTLPSLRPLIAAFNIRLGRWLPNPFSSRVQKAVEERTVAGRFDKDQRLRAGYNELVPEMLGLDGPRIYVSDGGHYDNLGLVELLRAKCADIWCVDASPEPAGESAEITRVLTMAKDELKIIKEARLDCTRFRSARDGFYPSTHAVGELIYPDNSRARFVVVKLGLAKESPIELQRLRHTDRGFPHHSTFWNQVYSAERMDAYRKLGRDAALRCCRDPALNTG